MEAYGLRTNNLLIGVHPTKISIQRQPSSQEITQPKGEQSIKQRPARMEIKQKHFRVEIDQSQCFAEAGRKNITAFQEEYVSLGQQIASEGILRRNEEGRMLRDFQKSENSIRDIAKKNFSNERADFTMVAMPRSRPKIKPIAAEVKINFEPQKPEISYQPRKPEIVYKPGKVGVNIESIGRLEFTYFDDKA